MTRGWINPARIREYGSELATGQKPQCWTANCFGVEWFVVRLWCRRAGKTKRVNRIVRIALVAAVFATLSAAHASASTIGPNCGTCQGSTYTLTNLGLAATDLNTADNSFDT